MARPPGGPLEAIKSSRDLTGDTEKALVQAFGDFADSFTTSEGTVLGREQKFEAMDPAKVGQEKVQVRRPAPAAK